MCRYVCLIFCIFSKFLYTFLVPRFYLQATPASCSCFHGTSKLWFIVVYASNYFSCAGLLISSVILEQFYIILSSNSCVIPCSFGLWFQVSKDSHLFRRLHSNISKLDKVFHLLTWGCLQLNLCSILNTCSSILLDLVSLVLVMPCPRHRVCQFHTFRQGL